MYVSLLCENVFLLFFAPFPFFDFSHMYTCSNLYNTRKRGARGKPNS